jgi:hypothetical protein
MQSLVHFEKMEMTAHLNGAVPRVGDQDNRRGASGVDFDFSVGQQVFAGMKFQVRHELAGACAMISATLVPSRAASRISAESTAIASG